MKKLLENRWMLLGIRCLAGGMFLYAGISKITNPLAFADSIETFKLLPAALINLLALSLPPFEILAGFFLIVGIQKRASSLILFLLTFVFIVGLAQALIRGLPVDCGCFGSGQPSPAKAFISLLRDMALIAMLGWFYFLELLPEFKNIPSHEG